MAAMAIHHDVDGIAHREAQRLVDLKGVVPTQMIDQAGDTTRNDEATLASQEAADAVASSRFS